MCLAPEHAAAPDAFGRLVAVDVGNTHIKLALLPREHGGSVPDDAAILRLESPTPAFEALVSWLPPAPVAWCVASVSRAAECRLADWVARHRPRDRYQRLTNDRVPIEIRVEAPQRVGTDRLLAALAAAHLRPAGQPAIVVDAGSAITVDLVSADGAFEGGAILPGFEMMAQALAERTDALPLVDRSAADEWPAVIGKSTVTAIRSGLFWGHVGAVRELIDRIAEQVGGQPQVLLAGGDAAKLAPLLPRPSRIVPHLVFLGIALADRAGLGQPSPGPRHPPGT